MRLFSKNAGLILSVVLSLLGAAQAQAQEAVSNSLLKQRQAMKLRQAQKQAQENGNADKDKKWNGSLGMILQGKRFDSNKTQKSTTVFSLAGDINYLPNSWVRFNLSPSFDYINGYIQTESKTDAVKSIWGVSNAAVDFLPNKYIVTSLGALDQNAAHTGIMFDSYAFPAAKVNLTTDPESDFSAGLQAESAIVASTSVSTEKTASEKTPTFNSAGIQLKKQNGTVEGFLKGWIYEFNNLPSSVADDSSNVGNSTLQIGTNPKSFIYQYKGYLAQAEIKTNLTKYWSMGLRTSYVKNSEAPAGYSEGSLTRFFIDADVSNSLRISPYYDYFRIEPDATVASLNDSRYNTNRVGYLTGLAFNYKKSVKVTVLGGERDVIYVNPAQERERTWTLRVETLNVAF